MIDRRTFLRASAGAALGSAAFIGAACEADAPDATVPAGSDTTSFQIGQAGLAPIDRLGVQLYSLRSLMQDDFEGVLRQVADAGYAEVEFAGYYDRTPEQVRTLLDELGLEAVSAHVSLDQLRSDFDNILETAQTIGHQYVICPYLSESDRASLDNYKALAGEFNQFGQRFKDGGVQFGYHNHAFEFEPLDGQMPFDVLLGATDPDLVKMELDLYWISKAGQDPLAYFESHPGRFPLFHVKDMDASGEMAPVGQGRITFPQIFAKADQAGVQHYIVEHDNPQDPIQSITASYRYLKGLV